MELILMHFNAIKGPVVFFSFPEDISSNIKTKMRDVFNIDIVDHFFEITILKENIKITNLYIEIPSIWGRGNIEMVMLSVITDKDYNSEQFYYILEEYAEKMQQLKDGYKSFFLDDKNHNHDKEIPIKKEELRKILLECFEKLKQQEPNIKGEKITGVKIVKRFKKLNW